MQLSQIGDGVCVIILVVDRERHADPAPSRRQAQAANDAQPIMPQRGVLDGTHVARRPDASIQRLDQKARFIEKDDGRLAAATPFLIRRQSCKTDCIVLLR